MIRSRWALNCNRIITLLCLPLAVIVFIFWCYLLFPLWKSPQAVGVDSRDPILLKLHPLIQQALHITMTSTSLRLYNSSRPNSSRTELQVFLGCLADPTTVYNDDFNSSDAFSFYPDLNTTTVCDKIRTTPLADPWDTYLLCRHIIGMRIIIIGSQMTYTLHNRLLDILPSGSQGSQFRCHGPAFCTWHEICSSPSPTTPTPPFSSERRRSPPSDLSKSAILRFSMSSTLCPNVLDEASFPPYVSQLTGVREHNAQDWLEKARRSDLVFLSKSPVPAPVWSYVSSNISSTHRFNVRIPKPGSPEWNRMEPFLSLLVPLGVLRDSGVVEAAWKATVVKWLPELIETLIFLRTENLATNGRLLVWLGSSFVTGCASRQEKARIPNNHTDIPWFQDCVGCEDRCIFENAQVYIQNLLLNQILPRLGILYIPRANPSPSRAEAPATSPGTHSGNRPVNISLLPHMTKIHDAEDLFLRGVIAILHERGNRDKNGLKEKALWAERHRKNSLVD